MAALSNTSTLVANAINEISQMIMTGAFQPGDFLPSQKALAAQMGVGTSTIREATQVLVSMGLIESRSGKGTWVREDALAPANYLGSMRLRLGELKAPMVFETRLVMEVPITEYAAERATAEDIHHITEALHIMENALDDSLAFARADLRFHVAVARASHNELLFQFYQLASDLLSEVIEELDKLPGVQREAIACHRAVAEAIRTHDARKARESALDHLARIARLIHRYT